MDVYLGIIPSQKPVRVTTYLLAYYYREYPSRAVQRGPLGLQLGADHHQSLQYGVESGGSVVGRF